MKAGGYKDAGRQRADQRAGTTVRPETLDGGICGCNISSGCLLLTKLRTLTDRPRLSSQPLAANCRHFFIPWHGSLGLQGLGADVQLVPTRLSLRRETAREAASTLTARSPRCSSSLLCLLCLLLCSGEGDLLENLFRQEVEKRKAAESSQQRASSSGGSAGGTTGPGGAESSTRTQPPPSFPKDPETPSQLEKSRALNSEGLEVGALSAPLPPGGVLRSGTASLGCPTP